MKILFIEDDEHKLFRVVSFLNGSLPGLLISVARSVQSGLLQLKNFCPDLIILDMSLPVFDYSTEERGFQHLPFGGKDILEYLENFDTIIPVVVLTAFEQNGSGLTAITLKELHQQLTNEFPEQYIGSVWYSALEDKWQTEILNFVKSILKKI